MRATRRLELEAMDELLEREYAEVAAGVEAYRTIQEALLLLRDSGSLLQVISESNPCHHAIGVCFCREAARANEIENLTKRVSAKFSNLTTMAQILQWESERRQELKQPPHTASASSGDDQKS